MADETSSRSASSAKHKHKHVTFLEGDRVDDGAREPDAESSVPDDSAPPPVESESGKVRLVGRRQSIHQVLGGGKLADVFLWRDLNLSASLFLGVSAIWVAFHMMGYHFLSFICHSVIFALGTIFLWSNASSFIHMTVPSIPEVEIPEDVAVSIALALQKEINHAFSVLNGIASGQDFKQFLLTIGGLWLVAVLGSWSSFLTLFYGIYLLLHTVPVLYENYEDQVDDFVGRALVQITKPIANLHASLLNRLPKGTVKEKKI